MPDACKTLKEYALFTDRVRKHAEELEMEQAVDLSIEECIREGILKEFLEENKAEAKSMCLFEYDQEKHIRMEREEAWEDGYNEGAKKGRTGKNASREITAKSK